MIIEIIKKINKDYNPTPKMIVADYLIGENKQMIWLWALALGIVNLPVLIATAVVGTSYLAYDHLKK